MVSFFAALYIVAAAATIPVHATATTNNNTTTFSEEAAVANITTTYFEDGSGIIVYENGTERHFVHNITGPEYLYENDTIYHSSNLTEVFLD